MTKLKVLIADEHPAFREGLRQAVDGTTDIEVIATADDDRKAVQLSVEGKPDIAVLSVSLSNVDGMTVAKKIKEENPEIGIIMISSYSHSSYIIPALRAGALGYLSKTSPLEEFIKCIRSVKAGETFLDSRAAGRLLRLMVSESGEETKYIEKMQLREIEVLGLVAKSMNNRDIAARLGISEHTVHTHLTSIFRKLGVKSRTEAMIHALREGLLNFDDLA